METSETSAAMRTKNLVSYHCSPKQSSPLSQTVDRPCLLCSVKRKKNLLWPNWQQITLLEMFISLIMCVHPPAAPYPHSFTFQTSQVW